MKTIYLVRHGESETNAGGVIRGGMINPLTERGRQQAMFIAERCSKLEIDSVIASPFKRTEETAAIICDRIGKTPEYSTLFVEWDRGKGRIGKRVDDPYVTENNQTLMDNMKLDSSSRLADEENFEDLHTRAVAALKFLEELPEQNILLVGHGMFSKILLGRMVMGEEYTGAHCYNFLRGFEAENTGLTIARYDPDSWRGGWYVAVWNDHAHLADV